MYASRMGGDEQMSDTTLTTELSMTIPSAVEGENRTRTN